MATLKIKKGDNVKIIAGKDKGKEGKVLEIIKVVGDKTKGQNDHVKVLVEGANMITKHTKPSMANQEGGIVTKEAPIDISNVMLVHKGQAVKVGFKVEDGKKVRVAKKSGEKID